MLRSINNKNLLKRIIEWDSGIATLLAQCEEKVFEEANAYIAYARQQDLLVILALEESYPQTLKHYLGDVAPPLLFVRGNAELLHKTAGAVVGTRNPSKQGIQAAQNAAKVIVKNKASVVSGGAAGIDRAAHDRAIKAGGNTIVMLPQGILSWSFPEYWNAAFDSGRVTLVSSYLPNAPWLTHAAVSRNGLISALAQVVCVVEPRKQGGSILTMRHAIEQHKPAFVEPLTALPAGLQTQARPLRELPEALAALDLEEMRCARESDAVQIELL